MVAHLLLALRSRFQPGRPYLFEHELTVSSERMHRLGREEAEASARISREREEAARRRPLKGMRVVNVRRFA